MTWAWRDWPLTWLTNHHPSVLCHCWLGRLTRKIVSEMTYNVSSGTLNTTIPCYTGFQWGSGSPIKWLYWLTRCGPQPFQHISASWYWPMHHLGVALIQCSAASRSSYTHQTGPLRFFCYCSIHVELSTCWHSTVRKHSHFQTPLENPSVQTHLVLLCCLKHLCIFKPKGTIQSHYCCYYYYYY